MKRILNILLISVFFLTFANSSQSQITNDNNNLKGLWNDEKNEITMQIDLCDNAICGTIIWHKAGDGSSVYPLDMHNKNQELRSRPVLGLTVLTNIIVTGENKWKARYYDIKLGGETDVELELNNEKLSISTPAVTLHYKTWKKIS